MNWLLIILAIISILLIVTILMQRANTDGAGFGGDSVGGISTKKRGLEKVLFQTTIIVAIIFVLVNFAILFIN